MEKLTAIQLGLLISEIDKESINLILEDGNITLTDHLFETDNYGLILNIDINQRVESDNGDYTNAPEFTKTNDIYIEVVNIYYKGDEFISDNSIIVRKLKEVVSLE